MTDHASTPYLHPKIGAVLLRRVGAEYEVLVTQPKPTQDPDFNTAMGLMRGTPKYRKDGEWVDAPRDGQPHPQSVEWQPLYQLFADEVHEEAALESNHLGRHTLYDLGERTFTKKRGGASFPVHWLVAVLDEEAQASLVHHGRAYKTTEFEPGFIRDSLKSEWMTLSRFRELAAIPYSDASRDRVHDEYLPIVEDAVAGMEKGTLAEFTDRPPLLGDLKAPEIKPLGGRVHTGGKTNQRSM